MEWHGKKPSEMKLPELDWNGMKWINEGLIAMEWNELNWNKYGILMMIDEHMSEGRVEFKIWKMIELLNEWTIEWMHQSLSRSLTSDLDVWHRARSCLGRGCQETGNFPRGACFFFLRQRGTMILVEYGTGCKQVRRFHHVSYLYIFVFLITIQVYARVVRSKEEPWNPTRTFKYSTSSCAVSIRRYSHSKHLEARNRNHPKSKNGRSCRSSAKSFRSEPRWDCCRCA